MKEIELTRGYVAIVDDEDYERVNAFKWTLLKAPTVNYAYRKVGKYSLHLHRFILERNRGDGYLVDHINHNGLDNRRKNLRVFPQGSRGNQANRRPMKGSSSKYLGVCWDKSRNKWLATIRLGASGQWGKQFNLGRFDKEEDAARAYDVAACDLFGIAANLNFGEYI